MTTKKAAILLMVFTSVVILVILTHNKLKNQQYPITTDALSDRAKEFIANQNADGAGLWQSRRLSSDTDSPAPASVSAVVTDCFSLSLPFSVYNSTVENSIPSCRWQATVVKPRAHFVIGIKRGSLAEDSGILLRDSRPDHYHKMILETSAPRRAVVFQNEEEITLFLESTPYLMTLALTDIATPDSLSKQDLETLIESITINSQSLE